MEGDGVIGSRGPRWQHGGRCNNGARWCYGGRRYMVAVAGVLEFTRGEEVMGPGKEEGNWKRECNTPS
jgi:hypothetical protein